MASYETPRVIAKIGKVVLEVDPEGVLRDARSKGLSVKTITDFQSQAKYYWQLEKLMCQYANVAARNSAVSGATAGAGGPATAIALGAVDIANMAAQLYRLNQRLAIVNGFDTDEPLQRDKAQEIYLFALGFDGIAQAAIKREMARAVNIAGKAGAYKNPVLKLIIEVARRLGVELTSKQAAQFVPIVGGVAGAALSYGFAKAAANAMVRSYKDEFFNRWQVEK